MSPDEVLRELEKLGTARNRKVYGRHGVGETTFGVSFTDLRALTKRIKVDHELAEELWASGNVDARWLATMVADPGRLTSRRIDEWARDLDHDMISDLFASLVARSRFAHAKMDRWTRSPKEWVGRAGWQLLAHLAMEDEAPTDELLAEKLVSIEAGIHQAPNMTRHAMNSALIAIGIRNEKLRRLAVAAARRIGRVDVDHGETGCKTQDAETYIEKTLAHRRARGQKRSS